MTFDLSLTLADMKKRVAWDDRRFEDFREGFWISGEKPPYDYIRKHGRNSVPFRYTYNIDTPQRGPEESVVRLMKYYQHFSMRILGATWEEAKSLTREPVGVLGEALNNVLEHGGGHDKEGNIAVEHYHPPDPSRMVMRISFPEGKPWDYKSRVKRYLEFRKGGGLIKAGIGRGGFLTFSGEGSLVSYEDEGRSLLAVVGFSAD